MADLDRIKSNVAKMVAQGAPESDIDGYIASEGVTIDQIRAHKGGDLSWSDVPGEALRNLGPSAVNFGQSVVQPFLNPVETLTALRDLGIGVGSKVAGWVVEQDPEEKAKREAAANAVGQFLVDRYGSVDAFKKTLAKDPVGAMADLSTVLTGGAAAAGRLPGMAGQAARAAGAAGRAIDPLMAAGRVAGKGGQLAGKAVAGGLGITTGVGTTPIQNAFKAGLSGNQAFPEAMRGQRALEETVDMAKSAVSGMRADRAANYTAGTATLRQARQPISVAPINRAFARTRSSVKFGNYPRNPEALAKINEAFEAFDELKNSLGGRPITAEALDAFKQRIGAIRETTQPGTNPHRVLGELYNTVGKEIRKQVPEYDAAMKDYAKASGMIKEMEKTLSVSDKAQTDTTLRKLLSSQRNNVNTNFGRREKLVDDLARYEPDLPAVISGHTMSSMEPRGLARLGGMGTMVYGAANLDPTSALLLGPMSPRLVGEAAYAAGQGGRLASDFARRTVGAVPQDAVLSGVQAARLLGGQARILDDQQLTDEQRAELARQLGVN